MWIKLLLGNKKQIFFYVKYLYISGSSDGTVNIFAVVTAAMTKSMWEIENLKKIKMKIFRKNFDRKQNENFFNPLESNTNCFNCFS